METKEIALKVEGMTCNNCAAGISKSLKSAGFKDADANFIDGEVTFSAIEGRSPDEAIKNIESLGYKVKEDTDAPRTGASAIEKKFIFSLLFTIPLFLHMFFSHDSFINNPIVQIVLCIPVYIVGVMHFGKSAWGALKARYANMDVLIFIGSSAAFFYSLAGTIMYWDSPEVHDFMFFETAATIITLVLLGNVLEHRAVEQTSKQIGELTKLQSPVARIVIKVGNREKIYETSPETVKVGDVVQVVEGDFFPVDGLVVSGDAYADESAITGESDLVHKTEGTQVFSGTLCRDGNLRVEAKEAVKDSTLQKIIDLVKRARKEQPDIQILGDKVSGIFVPVVLVISALTFTIGYWGFSLSLTQAILNSVAVLVISCPCAMGLATPTAVVAGVGRAAKMGIMIKGGNTLERFAKATTIIFDKTGTLTTGDFEIDILENTRGEEALQMIKSIENYSNHPIAKSILAKFESLDTVPLDDVKEIKSLGLTGKTENQNDVFFGKAEEGSDLVLKINGEAVTRLKINDQIRAESKQAIDAFNSAGFKTIILSGDKEAKVKMAAEALGIKKYHSGMTPDQKLAFTTALSKSQIVVMVGDGINDGPALSGVQVGISLGGASSLAIDSARIVLMNQDVMQSLVKAQRISALTYRTIKQNLFWAFFYNVVAIPIAAVGLLNPMIAALAMAGSDVVVIGNSLRLRYRKV
ncbi:MAG: cadmium-translocating P-type ATPase [Flavobacteriales bacterium]|nr:cadmium-translocating P-type ATPase [Flavobacteriales bacterium]